MGNNLCACLNKLEDHNSIIFDKKSSKKLNYEIEEILHSSNYNPNNCQSFNKSKECSTPKSTFLNDFETLVLKLGKIIPEEHFDKLYKSIIKSTGLDLEQNVITKNPVTSSTDNPDYIYKKEVIEFFKDGSIYKGEWNFSGLKHGFGIMVNSDNSMYEGSWVNDKIYGNGRYIDKSGNYYEGKK